MKQLSDLQRNTLAHLGITQWQANDAVVKPELANEKPLEATDNEASKHKTSGLEQAPEREVIDALLVSFSKQHQDFVNDVLLAWRKDSIDVVYQDDANTDADYRLTWRIADSISLDDHGITSPLPNELNSQQKRDLWLCLHQQ